MQNVPTKSYGVLKQNAPICDLEEIAEQIKNLGYAVVDSYLRADELNSLSEGFQQIRLRYIETYGEKNLKAKDEYWTIRAPLTLAKEFLSLALNERLISIIQILIPGKFILNQQNGIINPAGESYNQAAWHRDLPYQHFVSTTPLAINALFCLDEFTQQNGATFVLPASHKSEAFPSPNFVKKNAIQIVAPAGSFVILDCMLFHCGGFNQTQSPRRAINHVYTIPFLKQQISLSKNILDSSGLAQQASDILGFSYVEPQTVAEYLERRKSKD
jgi:ectoine hydroxylase-related dioxygenase (phytanoyl-CoA dioxygenase family)